MMCRQQYINLGYIVDSFIVQSFTIESGIGTGVIISNRLICGMGSIMLNQHHVFNGRK